jgi:hypothetical protein
VNDFSCKNLITKDGYIYARVHYQVFKIIFEISSHIRSFLNEAVKSLNFTANSDGFLKV